jgi:hypothetical protein
MLNLDFDKITKGNKKIVSKVKLWILLKSKFKNIEMYKNIVGSEKKISNFKSIISILEFIRIKIKLIDIIKVEKDIKPKYTLLLNTCGKLSLSLDSK